MSAPLSETLRPQTLNEVYGQDHLVGPNGFLTHLVNSKRPSSILLWGPPGCGKTTIARLYAKAFDLPFKSFSAVSHSSTDIKNTVKELKETPLFHSKLILFVDEIHRFNKSQQDLFLPLIEEGSIILVCATTENPSFNINSALLSRLRVLTLNPLKEASLNEIISRYEKIYQKLPVDENGYKFLIETSQGDARHLLNMIENLSAFPQSEPLSLEALSHVIQKKAALYDKNADQHSNLISALHKSVRGSDPDASLYWFCRMLEGGEDPLYIARRLIRMASEDIGLADPNALNLCLNAYKTYETLGSPEGELALAEAVIYLALAPKSNALYLAYQKGRDLAAKTTHLNPPAIILNAPTKLMKSLGYGEGYQYDHDCEWAFSGQNYFPKEMERAEFYHPVERGFERDLKKRKDFFERLRAKKGNKTV